MARCVVLIFCSAEQAEQQQQVLQDEMFRQQHTKEALDKIKHTLAEEARVVKRTQQQAAKLKTAQDVVPICLLLDPLSTDCCSLLRLLRRCWWGRFPL